mmetsp:Transcript_17392/g.48500  ORF Transcript_17392/g.48500 Transcript_17392/m.48500 type:complete len:204 (+) Transcript_17392:1670-2281(+)
MVCGRPAASARLWPPSAAHRHRHRWSLSLIWGALLELHLPRREQWASVRPPGMSSWPPQRRAQKLQVDESQQEAPPPETVLRPPLLTQQRPEPPALWGRCCWNPFPEPRQQQLLLQRLSPEQQLQPGGLGWEVPGLRCCVTCGPLQPHWHLPGCRAHAGSRGPPLPPDQPGVRDSPAGCLRRLGQQPGKLHGVPLRGPLCALG